MAGFWFLGEKSISVSFTNVTFRLMNLNIYFFIRFETIFIWKTVFVTFFTKDSKRERKRMLQHHLASRRKNTNQTNWWILQCITTNCVDLWGFMRRIYSKSVSFVPFRPATLGFYFIPSRYSYLSRFNMNTDDALQKKSGKTYTDSVVGLRNVNVCRISIQYFVEYSWSTRSYWSGNVEMDYILNFVSIELWIDLRQKSDQFK